MSKPKGTQKRKKSLPIIEYYPFCIGRQCYYAAYLIDLPNQLFTDAKLNVAILKVAKEHKLKTYESREVPNPEVVREKEHKQNDLLLAPA